MKFCYNEKCDFYKECWDKQTQEYDVLCWRARVDAVIMLIKRVFVK